MWKNGVSSEYKLKCGFKIKQTRPTTQFIFTNSYEIPDNATKMRAISDKKAWNQISSDRREKAKFPYTSNDPRNVEPIDLKVANLDTFTLQDIEPINVTELLEKDGDKVLVCEMKKLTRIMILRDYADLIINGERLPYKSDIQVIVPTERKSFNFKNWMKPFADKDVESQFLHCKCCFTPLVEISDGLLDATRDKEKSTLIYRTVVPLLVGHRENEDARRPEYIQTRGQNWFHTISTYELAYCPRCSMPLGSVYKTMGRLVEYFVSPFSISFVLTKDLYNEEKEDMEDFFKRSFEACVAVYQKGNDLLKLCVRRSTDTNSEFNLCLLQEICKSMIREEGQFSPVKLHLKITKPFNIVHEIIGFGKWNINTREDLENDLEILRSVDIPKMEPIISHEEEYEHRSIITNPRWEIFEEVESAIDFKANRKRICEERESFDAIDG